MHTKFRLTYCRQRSPPRRQAEMWRRLLRVIRKKSAFKRSKCRSGCHPHIKYTLEIWGLAQTLEQLEARCCNLLELLDTCIGFEALEKHDSNRCCHGEVNNVGSLYGIPGWELAQRVGIEKKIPWCKKAIWELNSYGFLLPPMKCVACCRQDIKLQETNRTSCVCLNIKIKTGFDSTLHGWDTRCDIQEPGKTSFLEVCCAVAL